MIAAWMLAGDDRQPEDIVTLPTHDIGHPLTPAGDPIA